LKKEAEGLWEKEELRLVMSGVEWVCLFFVVGEVNRIEVWNWGGGGWDELRGRVSLFSSAGVSRRILSADQEVAWHLVRIGGEECCVRRGIAQRVGDKFQIIYGSKY
jgi:hypothetical protein